MNISNGLSSVMRFLQIAMVVYLSVVKSKPIASSPIFNFAVGSLGDPDLRLTSRRSLPVALYTKNSSHATRVQLLDNGRWKEEYKFPFYEPNSNCDLNGYYLKDPNRINVAVPTEAETEDIVIIDISRGTRTAEYNKINAERNNWECNGVWPTGKDTVVVDASGTVVGFMAVLDESERARYRTDGSSADEDKNAELLKFWSKRLDIYLSEHTVAGMSDRIIGKRSKGCKVLFTKVRDKDVPWMFNGAMWGVPDIINKKAVLNRNSEEVKVLKYYDGSSLYAAGWYASPLCARARQNFINGEYKLFGNQLDSETYKDHEFTLEPNDNLCSATLTEGHVKRVDGSLNETVANFRVLSDREARGISRHRLNYCS